MKFSTLFAIFSLSSLFAQYPDACQPVCPTSCEKSFTTVTTVEFLYWKYASSLLQFGRDGVGLTNASPQVEVPVVGTGTSFEPDFKYKPGFRLGLGFTFGPSRAFDCTLKYTWYYTNPSNSVSDFNTSFLPLNWITATSLTSPTYTRASFAMDLHYYYPEVQLGYTFKVNPYLTLRPFMALSNVEVDSHIDVVYDYVTAAGIIESAHTREHCFSWSIGPKIGLDFTARPVKYLSLYCGINFTQLASQVTVTTEEIQSRPALGTSFVIQNGKVSQVRSIPLFGLEIGPVYDQWFGDNEYHFQLRPTWQLSTLGAGQIEFLNNNNAPVPVGAEFRGLNIRALFEF